jgi:hypothetical protein
MNQFRLFDYKHKERTVVEAWGQPMDTQVRILHKLGLTPAFTFAEVDFDMPIHCYTIRTCLYSRYKMQLGALLLSSTAIDKLLQSNASKSAATNGKIIVTDLFWQKGLVETTYWVLEMTWLCTS